MRRRAFTLIELLVVITIITALVAIMLPATKRVRLECDRVTCASRQHMVSVGFVNYATDRSGKLPDMAGIVTVGRHLLWCWPDSIADTLRNGYLGGSWEVMTCPADGYADDTLFMYQPPTFYTSSGAGQFRITSFTTTMTSWLTPAGSFDTLGHNYAVLNMHDARASSPLLMDTTYRTPGSDIAGVWAWRWNTAPHSWHPYYGFHAGDLGEKNGRNLAGINITFADGSVRWRNTSELQPRVYVHGSAPYPEYWW